MQPYEFIIISLAVWRISSLLVDEMGPYQVFELFRFTIGVRHNEQGTAYGLNEFAEVFCCLYCLSIWVAMLTFILYALFPAYVFYLSLPLALSAAAIVVNKWTQ